ncbi:hypothetical protein L7F22_036188 [Adiantum nelumboides]|nr:hypothetical protein [Adiantum nelumboides]
MCLKSILVLILELPYFWRAQNIEANGQEGFLACISCNKERSKAANQSCSEGKTRPWTSLQMASNTQTDSIDQVSNVSVAEVSEAPDGLEDEIISADLGQGSMLEIDETLSFEENNLQIIPWNIQEEVRAPTDLEDEQKLFMHRGADILSACQVFSCFDCPLISLCRLTPYAKVRGLSDDVSGLKAAFGKEGYMQEKGAFIVSLWNCHKEKILISNDIKNKWDVIWKDINDEFEQELSKSVQLKDLSNHMFYVWDGNRRTVAWMEAIQEKFSNSKEKHCRVLCTVIDPTKVSEIAIFSILQRMNLKEKIKKTLFKEEKKKEEEKNYRDLVQKYCDRMGKMLNIIDPSLGTDWLAKFLGLKWGGWATLEKITMIATHDAPIQSKILWVSLLEADMVNRTAYGLRKSDHIFKDGVDLSHDCTLAFYFDEIKHEARSHLYPKEVELEARSKDATSGALLTRKSYIFVFLSKARMLCTSFSCDTKCIALAGNYIGITADFRAGCKNSVWSPIHEHMLKAKPDLVLYTRSGKSVAWAADFIFFDVPFGGFHLSVGSVPGWDSLTEDHVRSGIQLSALTLADSGWLLIIASMGGDAIGWVERHCRGADMIID